MKFTHTLAAVAAAGSLALFPAVAHADTYSANDPAGDVTAATIRMDTTSTDAGGAVTTTSTGGTFVPARKRHLGDIVRIRVTHQQHVVRIKLRFAALRRTGGLRTYFEIRSNKGLRQVYVDAWPGHRAGQATIQNARYETVKCSVHHRIDYLHNSVLVVVPRSCLGNPRWVKVAASAATYTRSGATYADDARHKGMVTAYPHYGPRVYR